MSRRHLIYILVLPALLSFAASITLRLSGRISAHMFALVVPTQILAWIIVSIAVLRTDGRPTPGRDPVLRLIGIYVATGAFAVSRSVLRGWSLGDTIGLAFLLLTLTGWTIIFLRRRRQDSPNPSNQG